MAPHVVSGNLIICCFLDAGWYRYLMIFKGFSDADFVVFWQEDEDLRLIKLLSKSWISKLYRNLCYSQYSAPRARFFIKCA
jgi:hypothetical protein